jgi:hypothetical protein
MNINTWDTQRCVTAVWVKGSRALLPQVRHVLPQNLHQKTLVCTPHGTLLCGALHVQTAEGISLTHSPIKAFNPVYLLPFHVLSPLPT